MLAKHLLVLSNTRHISKLGVKHKKRVLLLFHFGNTTNKII